MNSEGNNNFMMMRFPIGPLETNCYLVYDVSVMEGAIIDPGWHDKDMLKTVAETKVDVKYVINTHGHADHIAGNGDFAAPVIIHRLDEACLTDPVKNLSLFSGLSFTGLKAGRTVEDGDLIRVGNIELEVLHTPGHTPGGISLKCAAGVFSGDTLFFEGIGRTDLAGGDLAEILESIEKKLMCLPDNLPVFPGHGKGTTIGEAKKFMRREFSFRTDLL
jgi:hydroxyacylglutathione hydrolase